MTSGKFFNYQLIFLSNKIDFNKAEFYETNLENVDFSSCKIEGCKFDYKSIKGIVIDIEQSHYLIGMLGVKIK